MKNILIVGLGNPGTEYENTRHNIGFSIIDLYCKHKGYDLTENKFNGIFTKQIINGSNVIISKPTTYMNLSGNFIKEIVNFYKININDILVIFDDMDLCLGKLRLKQNGSSGGHNGIKSIINNLGTQDFKRLKFGIGHPNNKESIINFVIGKFSKDEMSKIHGSIEKSCSVIDDFIEQKDFLYLMNKYNS